MTERRSEIQMEDLNLYDPDSSAEMFYGQFVARFKSPKGIEVAFVYRRVDPGTLLELTDQALLYLGDTKDDEDVDDVEVESDSVSELKMARVRMLHRLEVLQKCVVAPQFKNLDEIKNIPAEWQVKLYQLIMHGVLGGDTVTVSRFREEDEDVEAQ